MMSPIPVLKNSNAGEGKLLSKYFLAHPRSLQLREQWQSIVINSLKFWEFLLKASAAGEFWVQSTFPFNRQG
jgi:hypothetical protein